MPDILWCESRPSACELWVSHDQRLVALRPIGSPFVRLERMGCSLEVPEAHAVYVLNGDEPIFGAYRFRVHVHGVTDEVQPPRPLRIARGVAVATAMALTLGCGADEGGAVQDSSEASPTRNSAVPRVAIGGSASIDLGTQMSNTGGNTSASGTAGTAGQTIEVIPSPPN